MNSTKYLIDKIEPSGFFLNALAGISIFLGCFLPMVVFGDIYFTIGPLLAMKNVGLLFGCFYAVFWFLFCLNAGRLFRLLAKGAMLDATLYNQIRIFGHWALAVGLNAAVVFFGNPFLVIHIDPTLLIPTLNLLLYTLFFFIGSIGYVMTVMMKGLLEAQLMQEELDATI